MNARVETLIEQARRLSAEEQLVLAEVVYEMAAPRDPEWLAAWQGECERRLTAYDRGEVEAGDFDLLLDSLRKKYVIGAAVPLTKISNH